MTVHDWRQDLDLIAVLPWRGNHADDQQLFEMISAFADEQYASGYVEVARKAIENMSKYGMAIECTVTDAELADWYVDRHAEIIISDDEKQEWQADNC
jgi:aminoglycoside/choline kinase family phosphotransferase